MEAERLAASDRTLVPNRFVVRLHPDDLEGFADMEHVDRERARRCGPRVRASPPLHPRGPSAGRPARGCHGRAHRHPRRCPLRRPDRGSLGGDGRPGACRDARRRRRRSDPHARLPGAAAVDPGGAVARPRRGGDPDGRDLDGPDDRPRHGQRPRPARRTRLAPPRPHRRPARDARLHRPREHQRPRVNGARVSEVVLGAGDRIRLGGHDPRGRGRRGARPDGRLAADPLGVRFLFLGLLYLFLVRVVRALLRDLRAAARERIALAGRLVVVASPAGEPPSGLVVRARRDHTLGRDVNNAIVVEDPFASAEHAILTFRGRAWYVEDLGSTNGTYVNGHRVEGVAPLGLRRRDPGRPGPDAARAADRDGTPR